jgi:ATP-dependent Clp protease ATP-binding subunit ClpC
MTIKFACFPDHKQAFVNSPGRKLNRAMSEYPFERLSEDAKRTLVYAQEEAEELQSSYIGTEHILLAMFRLGHGSAHRALLYLGIDEVRVRATLDGVMARNRASGKQPVPTTRVKRVIEIAFGESGRMDKESVDGGHLLIGLATEGEGIAAHILKDSGASEARVIEAVEREMGVPLSGRGKTRKSPFRFLG